MYYFVKLALRACLLFVMAMTSIIDAKANEERESETNTKFQSSTVILDAMLKMEGFGNAAFDPKGRWLVYERSRPYQEFTDFSYWIRPQLQGGSQLWRVDLEVDGAPKLLQELDATPSSMLEDFSPDGRYLAVLQYDFGDWRIGAYDMVGDRFKTFAPTPIHSHSGESRPIWVSNEELLFSALPEGDEPEISVRAVTGLRLSEAWSSTWRGSAVSVSEVVSTRQDLSDTHEKGSLVLANASTGGVAVLAEGRYLDLRLAPSGGLVAAVQASTPIAHDPNSIRANWLDRDHRLVLIDPAAGTVTVPRFPLSVYPYTLLWDHAGERLAFFAWARGGRPEDGRFHVLDVATGQVSEFPHLGLDLVSGNGFVPRPERVVFLGGSLAVYARPIPEWENQSPRFSPRQANSEGEAPPNWYLLRPDREPTNLTSGIPDVSRVPVHAAAGHITVWGSDGAYRLRGDGSAVRLTPEIDGLFSLERPSTVYAISENFLRPDFGSVGTFRVRSGDGEKIVLIDLVNGKQSEPTVISAPSTIDDVLSASIDASAALVRAEMENASALVLVRAGNRARELASVNKHLNNTNLGHWDIVQYTVSDPEDTSRVEQLQTCILLPPGYDPERRYPVVASVYPGSGKDFCSNDARRLRSVSSISPYLWAARNVVYARVALPYDLIRTADGPISGLDELVKAAADALVADGYADPDRVVLFGFSNGGVSSLYAAAKSDRFAAVISMNGHTNFSTSYFAGGGVYKSFYADGDGIGRAKIFEPETGLPFAMGANPFDDPDMYIRNSPPFLARQINSPVMLIHTDMDFFNLNEYDQMFGALLRLGKEARYVRYWGEGHGVYSPPNMRDMWNRIDAFLFENGILSSPVDDSAADGN